MLNALLKAEAMADASKQQKPEYLGEEKVDVEQSKFRGWTPTQWALFFMDEYGSIKGAHHKQWVLDQVRRILHGTPVVVTRAKWSNGELQVKIGTGEPTAAYLEWMKKAQALTFDDTNITGMRP
jgi:hypothetical protein